MVLPAAKPRLFQSLSPENVQRLERLGPRKGFIKGRVVFTEGQPASEAFLLLEGRLTLSIGTGEEQVALGDVWPGEFAGERALLGGAGVHQVTVKAAANSYGLILDRGALDMLDDNTALVAIQQHLVRSLLRRLQGADLAVRKAWQEVRAAEAQAAAGDAPPPEERRKLVEKIRTLFTTLLGGDQ